MSTGPPPTRRESVLATIVLLPLRAIERSRGWRRVVLLVLYGLIALGTWAILWRRSQLSALPDVGDPFVGAAMRAPASVPDDRNAFVAYRRAVGRFRDMNKAEGTSFSKADFAWSRADATFRAWVAEHEEAISLLCSGAALPEFFIEYLASLKLLTNVQPLITAPAQQRHDRGPWHLFALAPGQEAFLDGEPERSRRVLNLLVASDLAWCDRPVSDRPAFAVERLRIPEPDAAALAAAKALAPEELARWADSALITPSPNWRPGELDKWERNDRWSFSQLTEAVAVSLFTKETGHAPASPAEALRRYRPTPGDTPDRDEAEPLP